MRALLIVVLIIVALAAVFAFISRRSIQAGAAGDGADSGAAGGGSAAVVDKGYWNAPLPPGYAEVADPAIKPEFVVEVSPQHIGQRNVLKFTVRETHGMLADGIQISFTHLIKDAATGEMLRDAQAPPLPYLVKKRLEPGGLLEDDTTLTGLELGELSDGTIGGPENWRADVVAWSRLASKQ